MSIDSLTIVTPRVNPIQYTSLAQTNVSGGVFSGNLDRIEVSNLNYPAGGTLTATITNVGGDEYDWEVTGLALTSIGINTIQVKAFDTGSDEKNENVLIYVDFGSPYVTKTVPTGTNIALNTAIQVTFNEAMEDDIASHLSIDPAVSGGYWQANANKTICEFVYTGNLDSTTVYTITVDNTCKDAIASVAVEDIYGSAGNVIQEGRVYSFTTGLALGPHNPTRLGLTPPQVILQTEGAYADFVSEIYSSDDYLNPYALSGYLSTGLELSTPKSFQGLHVPVELPVTSASAVSNNIPLLIRPFRDKKNEGFILEHNVEAIDSGGITKVNPIVYDGYLSTKLGIRSKEATGLIFDLEDIETFNYIPLILNFVFDDETSGGALHKVGNPKLSVTWSNPQDRNDSRLYYRVELSQTAAFAHPLVFDTSLNPEAFWLSDDGNAFVEIGAYGSPSGSGYTRFISPVDLAGGVWFMRIKTGNKVTGG